MGKLLRFGIALVLTFWLQANYGQCAYAQVAKLYPVDEAARDPSFFVFRARVLEAVQRRDSAFLLSILSPRILNSYGGNGGVAEFRQQWKPDRPDSGLWRTLTAVLALGGRFENDHTFAAPYTYSSFPDKFDLFEHGVVVGESVRVRQQPSLDGPVVGTLSYDIVKVVEWEPKQATGKQKWVRVALAGGSQGYIAGEYIRSPIDHRAIFEKKDGRWVLAALVAGD